MSPSPSLSSSSLDQVELAAWRGMLRAHRDLVNRLDDELRRRHAISLSSYEVLMLLSDADGGRLRMGELAAELLISRSGLTRLVDRLERDGLVRRERCNDDGRGWFAAITESGRGLIAAARPTHLDGVRRLYLAAISDDELELLGSIWSRLPADEPAAQETR